MAWIILLILGIVCAVIADSKGRSAIAWFFIGFLAGLIGLIILLVLPNLKEAEQKELHMENEQRRLREQLRQERIKHEQFRKHAQARLDTHDNALGLDTKLTPELFEIQENIKLPDGFTPPEPTILEDDQENRPQEYENF
jgi:hypothetical protein